MIIAVAGLHGTGKSTIAKKLAEKFGCAYHSAGIAFRQMAEDKGMNLEEFSIFAESHKEIDIEVDNSVYEKAKDEKKYVFEGQLPVYMLKDRLEYAILLTCSDEVRIQRMMGRDGKNLTEQLRETQIREESERQRFIDLYNIDVMESQRILNTFHLIVDTSRMTAEECFGICAQAVAACFNITLKN